MKTKVAFLGLGNMGRPMSANLIKAGFDVALYDVMPEAVLEAAKAGGRACKTIADAVKDANVVVSMVPSSPHVEDLYLGAGKVLELAPKSAILMDSSTISPIVAQKVIAEANKRGFEMCDTPVSGGVGGASAGTLTFMVGGSPATLEKIRPVISAMGKNIFHTGGPGTGQIAKICNNMLLAIHMIGTCEAINLGTALGIDPKTLCDIMLKSSGANWSLEKYNPYPGLMENVPAAKGYQGGFGVDLIAKDLGLAMESAVSAKSAAPLGNMAYNLYRVHSARGSGKLDFSSILNFLKN